MVVTPFKLKHFVEVAAIVAAAVARAMASACVFLGALGCFKVLFSKVSLTLRKFKWIVEVPQVCLRNGGLFFVFLEWL